MITGATPTPEQIINAVRESGYLMEQEVASKLEILNFQVSTNSAFKDEDEGKSREIDILATREYYRDTENKISIIVSLICECKNNTNPFVFIMRNKNIADQSLNPKEFVFPIDQFSFTIENGKYLQTTPAFDYLSLDKYHHFFQESQKAVQFCKIVRQGNSWKALHDGVYDNIFLPLVKALEYKKNELSSKKKFWNYVYLFYPMVVLNSDLFYINSNDTNAEPVSINHITFTREIKSSKLNGRYLIEFVNQEGLAEFVNHKISPIIDYLIKLAKTDPIKFNKIKQMYI